MKPSDITPYVWNRLLQTFDNDVEKTTSWLAQQNDVMAIWEHLLRYEGIIGYGFYLHQLHQHLWHPTEVRE